MAKTLEDLLVEYNSQTDSNENGSEVKAKDCCDGFVQEGGGCTCCPGSGDDQFECCQLGGCLACVSM